jgi:hypothetical protein
MKAFEFVVRHLRWLARVPALPQVFDSALLGWTCLAHRPMLAAMESLEAGALRMPGVRLRVHRFGGIEFVSGDRRELGHLHGHGLLDARVGRGRARSLIARGKVRRHHVFPDSAWVSYQLERPSDVPFALSLLRAAAGISP